MIFRQLFEPVSCTYSYMIGCQETGEAALIDPVIDTAERDLEVVRSLGLHLAWTLETHVHADHLTGARKLKALAGSRIAYPAADELPCADLQMREGEPVRVGNLALQPLATPGHTDNHHCFLFATPVQQLVFTGDALLIDACGRTDFQSGDARVLYRSIHEKLFRLPGETLVYPGHDYEGRFVSSIAQERARNPRLKDGISEEKFVEIMNALELPYPKKIDFSVPGNQMCGICPDDVPPEYRAPCEIRDQG
jgi:glyoxylase-like metal-dependent hydrolase (beta-lactamase superfamily II)